MTELKNFIKGFKEGLHNFGSNTSIIVNSVILLIIYLIPVGFTSIISKIINKKFLDIDNSKKNTYWSDLNLKKKKINEYYRQF